MPIASSSAMPAGTASSAWLLTNCIWPLMKLSNTGSPTIPFFGELLGHCVYLFFLGKSPPDVAGAVQICESSVAVRMARVPSTPGTYGDRPRAG